MIVMGIDPGTRHVGYGVIDQGPDGPRRLDSGTIEGSDTDLPRRLVGIHRGLQVVMREFAPDVAAVETAFFGRNVQTAIKIGEGRGVALLSAAEAEVEVIGYEPALVKKAVCGNGRAPKEQVLRAVCMLLRLDAPPATDHEADALALALCHLNRARLGLPTGEKSLPPAVLEALGGKAPPKRRRSRRR